MNNEKLIKIVRIDNKTVDLEGILDNYILTFIYEENNFPDFFNNLNPDKIIAKHGSNTLIFLNIKNISFSREVLLKVKKCKITNFLLLKGTGFNSLNEIKCNKIKLKFDWCDYLHNSINLNDISFYDISRLKQFTKEIYKDSFDINSHKIDIKFISYIGIECSHSLSTNLNITINNKIELITSSLLDFNFIMDILFRFKRFFSLIYLHDINLYNIICYSDDIYFEIISSDFTQSLDLDYSKLIDQFIVIGHNEIINFLKPNIIQNFMNLYDNELSRYYINLIANFININKLLNNINMEIIFSNLVNIFINLYSIKNPMLLMEEEIHVKIKDIIEFSLKNTYKKIKINNDIDKYIMGNIKEVAELIALYRNIIIHLNKKNVSLIKEINSDIMLFLIYYLHKILYINLLLLINIDLKNINFDLSSIIPDVILNNLTSNKIKNNYKTIKNKDNSNRYKIKLVNRKTRDCKEIIVKN